jgi:hypothetical protein
MNRSDTSRPVFTSSINTVPIFSNDVATNGTSSTSINPIVYFIPPILTTYLTWKETLIILGFFGIMFLAIVYFYVYSNLNEYQNRISVISNAYLFGQNPQQQFEKYVQNTQTEAVVAAMNDMRSTAENLNTSTYRLDDQSKRLSKQVSVDIPNNNQKTNTLATSIQKNIDQVRDTVSKLMGTMVLQNYITDGAIKTTQSPK